MKKNSAKNLTNVLIFLFFMCFIFGVYGQHDVQKQHKNFFWSNVRFGGAFGISVGSGFTDITIAPSAIYKFNNYVALGGGLQGSIVSQKDYYNSAIYGASAVTLFNPFEQVQLSAELEEMRVSTVSELVGSSSAKNIFWNTALFLGIGYRSENVTVGVRYNLLFDKEKSVYSDALMPFVRVYF